MPGSVASAVVPVVSGNPLVLPKYSYRSFVESREFLGRWIEYHDGSVERLNMVATARRSWKLTVRLAPATMVILVAFLKAHGIDPFYWYSPKESSSGQLDGSNWDSTGVSVIGRYTVRFVGDLAEAIYIPRTELSFGLIEIA